MASKINRACWALVEKEEHFAARIRQRGPVTGKHGLVERGEMAADVVRDDHLAARKNGAYFGIEGVESAGSERLGFGEMKCSVFLVFFGLD